MPTKYLRDIRGAFATIGLPLNFSKCKAQTCACLAGGTKELIIDDIVMVIVPARDGFQVLGTQYTVLGGFSAELDQGVATTRANPPD